MVKTEALPIFYSYRRCPYAMRARMAILYSGASVAVREVVLRDKPKELLTHSPKGTVPVLLLPNGQVLEQSMDIMHWALSQNDPDDWLCGNDAAMREQATRLIHENDHTFKKHLDHYKYAERHPEFSSANYRAQGEIFLMRLESNLQVHRYLLSDRITLADIALMPFVRQFSHVDKQWFEQAPYPHLQHWLKSLLDSALFLSVMRKDSTML